MTAIAYRNWLDSAVSVVASSSLGALTPDNLSDPQSFTIRVGAVNDAPTLDAIADRTIAEDALTQTVTLTGITAGPANEASQRLSLVATSSA